MSDDETPPALSAAEWTAILLKESELTALRDGFGAMPFSSHALAALLLFRQPFGFSIGDVVDEREVAGYCQAMAAKHEENGEAVTAQSFRELGERHRARAARIAALLPPPGVDPEAG